MKIVIASKAFDWSSNTTYEEAFDKLEEAVGKVIEEGEARFKRLVSVSHSITSQPMVSMPPGGFRWKGSYLIIHETYDN